MAGLLLQVLRLSSFSLKSEQTGYRVRRNATSFHGFRYCQHVQIVFWAVDNLDIGFINVGTLGPVQDGIIFDRKIINLVAFVGY